MTKEQEQKKELAEKTLVYLYNKYIGKLEQKEASEKGASVFSFFSLLVC